MKLTEGAILQATPLLNGSEFESAHVYLAEYNSSGAVGFIFNQPYRRNLNELAEFSKSRSFPLYKGGPVGDGSLYFLHNRPDIVGGGTPVADGIYLAGDFKKAVSAINSLVLLKNNIKLFIGYCGWDEGELETEIEEGSWLVKVKTPAQSIF